MVSIMQIKVREACTILYKCYANEERYKMKNSIVV
jgi:hypothetical protein